MSSLSCRLRVLQLVALLELGTVTWHAYMLSEETQQTKAVRLGVMIDIVGCMAAIVRVSVVPLALVFQPGRTQDGHRVNETSSFGQVVFGVLASLVPFSMLYLVSFLMLAVDKNLRPPALLAPPAMASCCNVVLAVRVWIGFRELQATVPAQPHRGASRELIGRSLMTSADFRTFVFGESDSGSTQQTCPICFTEFQGAAVLAQLPCGHCFHWACIDAWLSRSSSCPMRCSVSAADMSEPAGASDRV
mmetsp:Transcript_11764/g.25530  ORF Transcript_11764/g.25530 Transcript_11764/m.25530 type:complete len:247 (+) Transcript_11764:60-800(+)